MTANKEGQWSKVSTQWQLLGPPLRPAAEDVSIIKQTADQWCTRSGKAPRALIMGVTPEYHNLPWPEGSIVNATDNNQAMIDYVWPGDKSAVKLDSWTCMDWPENHFDIAVCDGGLQLLDHPHSQNMLVEKLANILSSNGLFILRLFSLPKERKSPEQVITDLLNSDIDNINSLKILLGTAMQDSPQAGICLDKIWQYLHKEVGDWPSLAKKLGWPLDQVSAIDGYKGSQAHYYFMSPDGVERLFCDKGLFTLKDTIYPSYTLGEQCPILIFERN